MADEPTARAHPRIDASEVVWVDIADDRRRLCLRLLDHAGRPASVSLPVDSLNTVLSAVMAAKGPTLAEPPSEVHRLDGWSLGHGEHGLLLTLQLPDGTTITFAVKPWQIAAMASLADTAGGASRHRLN